MNMNGINGERAAAAEDVLALADGPLPTAEIVRRMKGNGHSDLLPRYGHDECIAKLLRHLESAGVVARERRVRQGHSRDYWSPVSGEHERLSLGPDDPRQDQPVKRARHDWTCKAGRAGALHGPCTCGLDAAQDQPRNHAPWCSRTHDGPCPAENAAQDQPCSNCGEPLNAHVCAGAVQPSREDEPLDSLISPIWRHVHEARAERDAAEAERDALRVERDQWQNEAQQGYEIVEALRVENTRLREELAESVRALEAELDEAQGKLAVSLANPCATCQRRADRAEARVRQLTEALEQIASAERPSRTRGMPAHKLRQFARAALTEPPAGEEKP